MYEALDNVTQEILRWREANYPKAPEIKVYHDHAKLSEEVGELVGAWIKLCEGRGTEEQWLEEFGDVLIALCTLSVATGHSLGYLLDRRWSAVSQRTSNNKPTTDGEV